MTRPLILGTSGHIDHGKTSLVNALTGVDCDRLPEERERGITIELGFAPLDLPSGRRLGIVDVPGHEKLVRTMVAGATGIDLVLFVVAADEGIMPQTREHLAICELLGVHRGVVALTKIDAVDDELAELARLEVEEEFRSSSLSEAAVIPVSAHRGDGLDELVAALDTLAEDAPATNDTDGPAWLPVDRVFTMRGFGTVATGTLRGGPFEEGMSIEIFPDDGSAMVQTRVRGLQVHGQLVKRAPQGSRCAVNLHGIDVAAVPRGSVVASPGRVDFRPRVEVAIRLLPSAPPLRAGTTWTVHLGTAERTARMLLLDRDRLEPGERGLAELRFSRPVAAIEGDRYILRGFSRIPDAGWTIGGGRILDAAPFRGRRRRSERVSDLEIMSSGDNRQALAARLRRARLSGIREGALLRQVISLDGIEAVRVGNDRLVDPGHFTELVSRCAGAVGQHHVEQPTDAWAGVAAVTRRLPPSIPEEVVRAALDAATRDGVLDGAAGGYRSPGHAAHVADPAMAQQAMERLEAAGLAPTTLEELERTLGVRAGEVRPVLEHLVRDGRLVRVTSQLFFARDAIDSLRDRVSAHLAEHGTIDPATYKTLTGQSRKFTVPLMEFFDSERLTVRRGNLRVLRQPPR